MRITAELSLYPLAVEPIATIFNFIEDLRQQPGIEVVSNQMSTQIRGEQTAVMAAVSRCLEKSFSEDSTQVLVAKFINADLPLRSPVQDGSS